MVWVRTSRIQLTKKAPVMPSSASAIRPYAWPPTMVLVTKPVRIPIVSSHQGASIRNRFSLRERCWNRARPVRENRRELISNGRLPQDRSIAPSSPHTIGTPKKLTTSNTHRGPPGLMRGNRCLQYFGETNLMEVRAVRAYGKNPRLSFLTLDGTSQPTHDAATVSGRSRLNASFLSFALGIAYA